MFSTTKGGVVPLSDIRVGEHWQLKHGGDRLVQIERVLLKEGMVQFDWVDSSREHFGEMDWLTFQDLYRYVAPRENISQFCEIGACDQDPMVCMGHYEEEIHRADAMTVKVQAASLLLRSLLTRLEREGIDNADMLAARQWLAR
jgi:hypothetical protein